MNRQNTIIDVIPDIPIGPEHGQEVPYGWKVRIHRWLGGKVGANAYDRVPPPPPDSGDPLAGSIAATLSEHRGREPGGEKVRDIFADRRYDYACQRGVTGWSCAWYDQAEVTIMPPFQNKLSSDPDRTFVLTVEAFDREGAPIGTVSRSFANLPTYCLWDVELDRPGGVERVIEGHRVVAGTRAAIYLGDFSGVGRAGFLHVVGTNHFAAYDSTGEKLRIRSYPAGVPVYNSTNACVFDINGDGKDEVIAMTGKPPEAKLEIIEGASTLSVRA